MWGRVGCIVRLAAPPAAAARCNRLCCSRAHRIRRTRRWQGPRRRRRARRRGQPAATPARRLQQRLQLAAPQWARARPAVVERRAQAQQAQVRWKPEPQPSRALWLTANMRLRLPSRALQCAQKGLPLIVGWRRRRRTLERTTTSHSRYAPEVSTNSADTASGTALAPIHVGPSQSSLSAGGGGGGADEMQGSR